METKDFKEQAKTTVDILSNYVLLSCNEYKDLVDKATSRSREAEEFKLKYESSLEEISELKQNKFSSLYKIENLQCEIERLKNRIFSLNNELFKEKNKYSIFNLFKKNEQRRSDKID